MEAARLACSRSRNRLWPVALAIFLAIAVPQKISLAQSVSIEEMESPAVRIIVGSGKLRGSGTGFIVSRDGYVITNYHVVRVKGGVSDTISVIAKGQGAALRGEVKKVWEGYDLALIQVRPLDIKPVIFNTAPIPKGNDVIAIGFPGLADRLGGADVATVTKGIVGKLVQGSWRGNDSLKYEIIQHSAAINPGNSGGPLFNTCGHIIGVNTQGSGSGRIVRDPKGKIIDIMAGQGVFYASSVSVVMTLLDLEGISYEKATYVCGEKPPPNEQKEDITKPASTIPAAGDKESTKTDMAMLLVGGAIFLGLGALAVVIVIRQKKRNNLPSPAANQILQPNPQAGHDVLERAGYRVTLTGSNGQVWQMAGATPPAVHTIGRNQSSSDIVIEIPQVSRLHAELRIGLSSVEIRDVGSSNGTFINDNKIPAGSWFSLRNGDEVSLSKKASLTVKVL